MKRITLLITLAFLLLLLILLLPLSLLTVPSAAASANPGHIKSGTWLDPAAPLGASGVPDAAGYTYQDDLDAFGPAYVFTDIAASGSALGIGDEGMSDITLPFAFTFYGTTSNKLRVSNNGAIIFDPAKTDRISSSNPCPFGNPASLPTNVIAPWWDDWTDTAESDVYVQTFGTAPNRYTIIQWDSMLPWPETSGVTSTFQVILYETSNVILFQYRETDVDNGASGTIGIRGGSDTDRLVYGCNTPVLAPGRAIRFQQSSVTVEKLTETADSTPVFTFSTTGTLAATTSFTLTHGQNRLSYTAPGTYTISEDSLPQDWALSDLACTSTLAAVGDFAGEISTFSTDVNARRADVNYLAPGDNVTCTFTNASTGRILIDKVTDPAGDTTPFAFEWSDGQTLTQTFSLSDTADLYEVKDLEPGTYMVTETLAAGWGLAGATCSSGDPESIAVNPGQTVTCVFTNTKLSRIVVDKVTEPAGEVTVFPFSWGDGQALTQTFSLSDPAAPYEVTDLWPGTYVVTETAVTGWDLSEASCEGQDPAAIGLGAGETVTCVFTNTERGMIEVDKVTDPAGDPTEFEFSWGDGQALTETFVLSDPAAPHQITDLVAGTYVVTETGLADWDLTGVTCGGEDPDGIVLSPGEKVTCVFTNTAQPGWIVVDKVTEPGGDGTDFPLAIGAGGQVVESFVLSDTAAVYTSGDLRPGTYVVTETAAAGWGTEASCDNGTDPRTGISLASNETVTCVFTNTKLSRIVVDKVTEPAGEVTVFPFSWGDGQALTKTFSLSDTGGLYDSGYLWPGTYAVTETGLAGWDLSEASCEGEDPAAIVLGAGETVTCVFTNTVRPSSLTVVKNTVNPDTDPQDFTFKLDGIYLPVLDDDPTSPTPISTTVSLTYGTYDLVEVATQLWSLLDIGCDDPSGDTQIFADLARAQVQLSPGEHVTCVFTNTQSLLTGSITIVKQAITEGNQVFSFTGDLGNFSLIDDGQSSNLYQRQNLAPGTYVITETAVAGWNLTGLSCNGAATINGSSVAVGLAGGQSVTCVFTNTAVSSSKKAVYLPIVIKDMVALPNLTTSLSVNTTVNPPLVTVVVRNTGTVPVDEPFWVDFYVNPSTLPKNMTGSDRRWQKVSSRGIAWPVKTTLAANGGAVTLTSASGFDPAQSAWTALPPGNYTFYAFADSFDNNDPEGALHVEVPESDETDNQSQAVSVSISGVGSADYLPLAPPPLQPRSEP